MKTLITLLTSLSLINSSSNCIILTFGEFIQIDDYTIYEEIDSDTNYDIDLMDYELFPE